MTETKTGYSLRHIFRHSLIYSVSDLLLKLFGFFLIPIYTHRLTPADYGTVGVLSGATQTLGAFLGFGIIGSLPVLYYSFQNEERDELIQTGVIFTLVQSLLICVGLTLWGKPLFHHLAPGVPFQPHLLTAVWTTFFSSLYYLPLGIFNMREDPRRYAVYSSGAALLNMALAILLVVHFQWGAFGVVLAQFIASVAMFAAAVMLIRGIRPRLFRNPHLRAALSVALPAFPHVVVATLVRFSDRFFLVKLATLNDTGLYSLAIMLCSVIMVIQGGISSSLNPQFYRRANADDATLPQEWARLSSLFVLVSAFLALGFALFSEEVIRLMAPPSYLGAIKLVPLLAVATTLYGLYAFLSPGIGYRRRTWAYPAASVVALGVNLTLNSVLIPRLGATGSAYALLTGYAVQLSIFYFFAQSAYRIPYERGKIVIAVVGAASTYWIVRSMGPTSLFIGILLKTVALMLYATAIGISGFFTGAEVQSMKVALRNLRPSRSIRK